jgi:uncharacterized protein with HEPN domain
VSPKDPNVFLAHARDCLERITEYATDGEEVFLTDRRTQDAILRNLEIVGQCIKDAGVDHLASLDASIDWRIIGDFRNVLAHAYLSIKIEMVWSIIQNEVPRLSNALKIILENWEP